MLKRDKIYIGLHGAAVKSANALKAECLKLNEKKYDEEEWKEFIVSCYNEKEYEMRHEEFKNYVTYIVNNSYVKEYKDVITKIYNNVSVKTGFNIPTSKRVKKMGYNSVLSYIFTVDRDVFQAVIYEARVQATKLGYSVQY